MGITHTIEDMQKRAEKRDGKCLSKIYVDSKTKLKWGCSKGHIFYMRPSSVGQGHWCNICGQLQANNKHKLGIEKMQEIAKSRGGKCISPSYTHGRVKLEWECGNGHRWKVAGDNVKQGSWCPICMRIESNKRTTITKRKKKKEREIMLNKSMVNKASQKESINSMGSFMRGD